MRRGGGWRKRGGKSAAQWASTRSSAPLDLRDVFKQARADDISSRATDTATPYTSTNLRHGIEGRNYFFYSRVFFCL